jgi:hypothetical protein
MDADETRYPYTSSERPTASRSLRNLRSPSRSRSKNNSNVDGSGTQHDNVHSGDHHAARFSNHEPSGDMPLNTIAKVRVEVKGKGKVREMYSGLEEISRAGEDSMDVIVDVPASVKSSGTPPNGTTMDQSVVDKVAEPSHSKSIRQRGRARGRGRTLLESVHSHLSFPQTNANSSTRKHNRLGVVPQDHLTPVITGSPSLLARLSDPGTQNISSLESSPPVGKAISQLSADTLCLSASDIMARTRVRLAKLKNEPVAGVPPSAPTPSIARSVSSATSNVSTSLRNKLLGKLEEEKRYVSDSDQVPSVPTTEIRAPTNSEDALDDDSLIAESNLRMQAQLRVQLVAAKRARDNHDVGRTFSSKGDIESAID